MRNKKFAVMAAVCVAAMAVSLGASAGRPQNAPAAPTSGVRAEFLSGLDYFEQRFTKLAGAVPQDKYTWRPGEGVRSISEVYLHVCAANFSLPRLIGTQPPAGVDLRGLEKSTTDKAKIIQTLKDSFAHARNAALALSDADVEKPVKLFGQDSTYRGAMTFILRHLGEHLGQSIAYARMNGVVPPWTEEQQQRQQEQKKQPEKKQ
jgi:uncharacterized damage-inducible protein DinB